MYVIKFLIIRYLNSKNKKLNNQVSSLNKEKSNKKMSLTSNSKLNKKTLFIKKNNDNNNDKQIFENIINAFFANDLDWKNVEKYIFKLFDKIIN